MQEEKKVLIVGSGARESAMAWKCAQAPGIRVHAAPGNAAIGELGRCISVSATDIEGLVGFARDEQIDITIVGPELPLVMGITDRFRAEGLLICGPSREVAMLTEGSKTAFKELLVRHGLPTAPFVAFDDPDVAFQNIRQRGVESIVIKADGLAGGKGVMLPKSLDEADRCLKKLMVRGMSGEKVVIEDRLFGIERSAIALTDGRDLLMLPFTQDYKRELDGDEGENTGGMGAHTIVLSEAEEEQLIELVRQVLEALAKEGHPYTGFIYIGFIMTADGPMILECNCRLGDPEAQAILASMSGNFVSLCMASAFGTLRQMPAPIRQKHAVCVVLASETYPESSESNEAITDLTGFDLEVGDGTHVFYGAIGCGKNRIFTTNKAGRVASIVGTGVTLEEARKRAYAHAWQVDFMGRKYRKDIGGAPLDIQAT